MKGKLAQYSGSSLLLLLGVTGQALTQSAEEEREIVAEIRFSSPSPGSTAVYNMTFGVGDRYTDTTDKEFETQIPFGNPGATFLTYFDRRCDVGTGPEPCLWQDDRRAIPDSVTMGGITRFQVNYVIRMSNSSGTGLRMAIDNGGWPLGIDSIRFVDRILPGKFTRTFTGPFTVTIEDPATAILDVTVFYNLQTLSIDAESLANSIVTLTPNPLRDGSLSIHGRFAGNDRLLLVDALGRIVEEAMINEETTIVSWDALTIPSGVYFVIHVDEKGMMQSRRTLNVMR